MKQTSTSPLYAIIASNEVGAARPQILKDSRWSLFAAGLCWLLSLRGRACPVGYPMQAERGEGRQQRQERDCVECVPSEEAAGDGAEAIGQEHEDLPLGDEAQATR